MKLTLAILAAAVALQAEYPKDAAARFKMKQGIAHPVAEREARAKALAALSSTQDQNDKKADARAARSAAAEERSPSERSSPR